MLAGTCAAASLLLAGCGQEEDVAPPATTAVEETNELAESSWLLESGPGVLEALTTAPPTLTFEQDSVSGFAGCNRFTGELVVEGDEIAVEPTVSAIRSCPEIETLVDETYLDALASVATWSIVEDQLRLADADGTVLLWYGPPTIEGSWRATGIRTPDGDTVADVPAGVDPTISFFRNGTVTGSAGCNDYSGTYVAFGEALQLSELATTEMACAPEVMEAEAAYLDALRQATQLRLTGDALDLLDEAGSTLLLFERGET